MALADRENNSGFNTPVVVLCGAAAVIFLFALALFLQGGFLAAQAKEYESKVYNAPVNQDILDAEAEQRGDHDEVDRLLAEKTRLRRELAEI